MSTPKDHDEKVRRGYVEQDSIVWADGREKLVGRDWKARIEDLRLRCRGQCEWRPPRLGFAGLDRCTAKAQDPHHIIRRSVKRDDRLSNLQALCRFHHDLMDKRKPRWTKKDRETCEAVGKAVPNG